MQRSTENGRGGGALVRILLAHVEDKLTKCSVLDIFQWSEACVPTLLDATLQLLLELLAGFLFVLRVGRRLVRIKQWEAAREEVEHGGAKGPHIGLLGVMSSAKEDLGRTRSQASGL